MFSDILCPKRCPGCKHRKLTSRESLEQKYSFLKSKLVPWSDAITPVIGVEEEYRNHYRKKVCLKVLYNDNRWEFGMISGKEFIATPNCPVHDPLINKSMAFLSEIMPSPETFPLYYYMQSGKQILLVLKTSLLPDVQWLFEKDIVRLAELGVEGLWIHLNPSTGNKILLKHNFHLIYGKSFSMDNGMQYGPMSFQQLIPELYNASLDEALNFFDPDDRSIVIDLYCGIGYSMHKWVERKAFVAGVELNGEATECCRINVPESIVFRGKCHDRIPQLNEFTEKHFGKRKLLYLNPPRTGLEPQVLKWIAEDYRPDRMAYLSCSAGTLSRDLDYINHHGYRVEKIIPYDFFPQTIHVECLALMRKE
jgi:23S rRNA (uracil1939-C5)-methyltransferase